MKFLSAFSAFALALGLSSTASAADLSGAEMSLTAYAGFDISNPTFNVGPGVETTADYLTDTFTFDFTETGLLTVGYDGPYRTAFSSGFGQFVFTDIGDTIADFSAFTLLSSSTASFTQSKLNFTADTLRVNFTGFYMETGTLFTAQIETAVSAVPLPATLPALLLGIGGLATLRRRQRRAV